MKSTLSVKGLRVSGRSYAQAAKSDIEREIRRLENVLKSVVLSIAKLRARAKEEKAVTNKKPVPRREMSNSAKSKQNKSVYGPRLRRRRRGVGQEPFLTVVQKDAPSWFDKSWQRAPRFRFVFRGVRKVSKLLSWQIVGGKMYLRCSPRVVLPLSRVVRARYGGVTFTSHKTIASLLTGEKAFRPVAKGPTNVSKSRKPAKVPKTRKSRKQEVGKRAQPTVSTGSEPAPSSAKGVRPRFRTPFGPDGIHKSRDLLIETFVNMVQGPMVKGEPQWRPCAKHEWSVRCPLHAAGYNIGFTVEQFTNSYAYQGLPCRCVHQNAWVDCPDCEGWRSVLQDFVFVRPVGWGSQGTRRLKSQIRQAKL